VKTSLDPQDSKKSNENDKSTPLYLKFLRKIHICASAVQKIVPCIPFSLSDPVFALRRPPEYSKTGCFRKSRIGPFWGEK